MKSQSFASYWPLVDSSHSQSWSNLRLRTMILLQDLIFKLQCLMAAPFAEKMVSPLLGLMSHTLTPETSRTGCSLGVVEARNGVEARSCAAEPISFQPRSRSFMISMTFTELAVLLAETIAFARSSAFVTLR